ncbi:group II truncated hemoglobin [Novosphingobium album (ex Liu et al. 2023)]|uniref:Group II truncated hemoglobin n=1 Tax=Novosphingobium album (ex Liu et al. 2023) TaxID=3031130 RepID=A0ABT5WP29_9SPHN|nr:group II truncated hemoglobin [Novosphingobium album (ex Liu et al. 2023)]MDE8651801.1 group II truncated hemoglobin [Novosphingobium album (ex Liu et al. 2023)]
MPTPAAEQIPDTPFYRLGGHATMEAICNRFYDLMESEPEYAELRAMHAADLAPMRQSLPLFLAGWSGGPRDWFAANPGRCMMSIHKPFTIGPDVAGQWAEAMKRAIADVAPEPADMARAMGEVLENLARGMARP